MAHRTVLEKLALWRARHRLQAAAGQLQAWALAAVGAGVGAGILSILLTAVRFAWITVATKLLALTSSLLLLVGGLVLACSGLLAATDIARDWRKLRRRRFVYVVVLVIRGVIFAAVLSAVFYASLIFFLSSFSSNLG
jgi:hypothetical protein